MVKCRFCKSENVLKYGFRTCRKKGKTQKYICRNCGSQFTPNEGFLHTANTKDIITIALDLYFKGLSLRKIKDHLIQFYNTKVSHTTIYYWIKNYSLLINNYTESLKIDSEVWNADETGLYFKRHLHWLWNIIDKDTKFLISVRLTKFKYVDYNRNIFTDTKKLKIEPAAIITDGFIGYRGLIKQNYPFSEHIIGNGIANRGIINTIERLNGSIKERYKIMRGFHSFNSAKIILNGWKCYYNFIRPHMSLNGKTPAEVSGINLNLKNNKWLNLIQKSAENGKISFR